jgi:hypothetical protein
MNAEFKEQVRVMGIRPTLAAKEVGDQLKLVFGWRNNNQPARLAIGRSLAEGSATPLPTDVEFGPSIRGQQVFGDGTDLDVWLTLLIMDGNLGAEATPADLRTSAEAHWHRGAALLRDDLDQADDCAGLMRRLSVLFPEADAPPVEDASASSPAGPIRPVEVKIGSISEAVDSGEKLTVMLSEQSTSPHVAFMGKTRRGKTYTAVQMADSVVEQSGASLLFIDPKREYVEDQRLSDRWPGMSVRPELIRVGQEPIPLDFLPRPGIGHQSIGAAAVRLAESIANCCQGAGAVQRAMLRDAITTVAKRETGRGLGDVRDEYARLLADQNKADDSVLGQLDILGRTLDTFEPRLDPATFFGRSWYLSLDPLPGEEPQRLVMLLLMDAMVDHFLQADNAPTAEGHRRLKTVVMIDEARRVLKQKKLESLSRLVREGASKGVVMMLLSQDPKDFDGQADDFTTQLGTVVAYGCNQSPRGLKALSGAYGRKLQPQEFADDRLPRGVAFCKLPERPAERVRAWEPD